MVRSVGDRMNDRQRVLDATDIVRLVGEHITLRPKGREYVCLCPFHDDHKPSMYVVPAKQIYHCFSCGAGGNAIDFAMNYHRMEFLEALRFLADRASIELTPVKRGAGGGSGGAEAGEDAGPSRADLAQANDLAAGFFRTILRHPQHGAAARAVVERRGIAPEMVEAFQIGAAPERWDGLVKTIEKRDLPIEWFDAAGLLKRREQGGWYDAFRNRLVFPIHDQIGRAIAFGARKIDEADEPKYLNSPETRLFDKGATLYGLHQAFRAIQNERTAVVTEGYMDVIACHQAGFRNVVATLGTALTTKHAAALRRMCDVVVLLFDADDAGARAADRALEVFFAEQVDVRIAVLPEGKDPDELFKVEGGAEKFRLAVERAVDSLDYWFRRRSERLAGAGLSARTRIVDEEIDRLLELGLDGTTPIRRRLIVRRLAGLAKVDEGTILTALERKNRRAGRPAAAAGRDGAVAAEATQAAFGQAEHALGCLLCDPSLAGFFGAEVDDILEEGAYPPGPARQVAQAVAARISSSAHEDAPDATLSHVLIALEDAEARRLATRLAAETERITDHDSNRLREHFRACVKGARLVLERASRDRMAAAETAAGVETVDGVSAGSGAETGMNGTLIERLERQRRLHADFGGDRKTLPRPAAAPGV